MPPLRGRPQRKHIGPSITLQTRVTMELHERAHAAAKGAGLGIAAYIAELIARDELDEHGRPLWAPVRPDGAEPLPGVDDIVEPTSSAA